MFKLAILHYLPLEYYPPITNLLNYLASDESIRESLKLRVYSTHNIKGRKAFAFRTSKTNGNDHSKNLKAKICRFPFPKSNDHSIFRVFKYLQYNILTLVNLFIYRPNILLYYESYSVWPAYIYSRFINRQCRIFIHNHEYASKDWYKNTMKQVQYFHQLEKKWLYPRAQWISQTNTERLQFFYKDHPYLQQAQLYVMPNYPPCNWAKNSLLSHNRNIANNHEISEAGFNKANIKSKHRVLKLIYVGSLSFQSTYIKELCEWVIAQNGKVEFDIYAYNLYDDVKNYLTDFNVPWIKYYEQGVEYDEQPQLLSQYDVGLILYKAHNRNYTYNAPNKLFEYLACNLDVWYSDVLQGPKPFNTSTTYPKVTPVDFENLDTFDWRKTFCKDGCIMKTSEFFCETEYNKLVKKMINSV